LQKQYRPPIDKVAIEVPAGLVDAGETPEQAAVREMKEETGYVAVVSETSPLMFNGACSASADTIISSLLVPLLNLRLLVLSDLSGLYESS
jgi:8-oxo-dGTP pyrophosphatase MutT (NUDIX family)